VNPVLESERVTEFLTNLVKDIEDGRIEVTHVGIDRNTKLVNLDGITLDMIPSNTYTCTLTCLEVN